MTEIFGRFLGLLRETPSHILSILSFEAYEKAIPASVYQDE